MERIDVFEVLCSRMEGFHHGLADFSRREVRAKAYYFFYTLEKGDVVICNGEEMRFESLAFYSPQEIAEDGEESFDFRVCSQAKNGILFFKEIPGNSFEVKKQEKNSLERLTRKVEEVERMLKKISEFLEYSFGDESADIKEVYDLYLQAWCHNVVDAEKTEEKLRMLYGKLTEFKDKIFNLMPEIRDIWTISQIMEKARLPHLRREEKFKAEMRENITCPNCLGFHQKYDFGILKKVLARRWNF